MSFVFEKYDFSPILGWSISRYELFDKCKRQYFYAYYPRYVKGVAHYKMAQLRDLTSVPLETGSVVHDVIEGFLKRLQKSDSDIDEGRFFEYARARAGEQFARKTCMEVYYKQCASVDMDRVYVKIKECLANFIGSPVYSWIYMKAITNKINWMIEPPGFGETRLDGMKAYCKMDFLMPVGDDVHILDWKTGKKDATKHGAQLQGYAAAAASNFKVPWERIYPKIVYLHPVYDELELQLDRNGYESFVETIRSQTAEMHGFCENVEENVPKPMDTFPQNPSPGLCRYCKYQELCFPKGLGENNSGNDGF